MNVDGCCGARTDKSAGRLVLRHCKLIAARLAEPRSPRGDHVDSDDDVIGTE